MSALAPIMQGFFTERLAQRRASEHTVAAYRDTFRLLLRYAQQQTNRPPSALDLADIGPAFVGGFLDHLENDRQNSVVIPLPDAPAGCAWSVIRSRTRQPGHTASRPRVLAWIRSNAIMMGMARPFTHPEIKALSKYLASLPGELEALVHHRIVWCWARVAAT